MRLYLNHVYIQADNSENPKEIQQFPEKVKVFLDVNPSTNGHMLIVPKKHYENILDIDLEIYNYAISLIKEKLYPLVKEKLNCDGITIIQNNEYGQEVKHLHIHVIPRYEKDAHEFLYNKELLLPVDDIYSKLKSE